jgi:hypothetical protein
LKNIDLFIKSFHKDFWLLKIALATIARHVTGYNNIILLIPEHEKHLFDTRGMPERTTIHYVKEYGKGWIFQQWCKLNAATYSLADYIMFTDSDCIWTYPVDLQKVIKNDKPEILYTDWSKVGDGITWKKPTEDIMGESVPFEFMRRNQLTYHRDTLVKLSLWKPNLEEIVMGSEKVSEFNLIGSFAYKFERDKYKFTDTDNWAYVPPLAEQLWSYGSKKQGVSETHLREYIRTLETILKAFGIDVP